MLNLRGFEILTVFNASGTPGAKTTTVTGTGVDMSGTDDVIGLVQTVGTVSGTTPTLDGKLQESSDNSTYTDCVPCDAALVQVVASTSLQVATYQRSKKHVRYVGTITGTTPSFALVANVFGTKKKY